jgi:quercetin dioxygenase-like cupin family protein
MKKSASNDPSRVNLNREDGVRVLRHEEDYPPTEVEAEAKLHQEGYESFKWHDVPGAVYPRHRHEDDECLWVLEGALEIELTETPAQSVLLHPGDRIYLPAKVPHRARIPDEAQAPHGVTYLVGQKK